MYKRLELHNHTTESDASLSPMDLLQHMLSDKVDAFAITDHNTISGQKKLQKLIADNSFDIGLIRGMELTTYYGHVLCLNTTSYIEWEDIDINDPEKFFDRAHDVGGLAGIAHPYSYGAPFARGCRFDMQVHDYTKVDFIEISNDLEPLHEVNERGLLLWQDLVLKGFKIAATSGMDLHGKWDMSDNFATFIEVGDMGSTGNSGASASDNPGDLGTSNASIDYEKELAKAIKSQKTWVSKGPILEIKSANNAIRAGNEIESGSGEDGVDSGAIETGSGEDSIICRIISTGKPGYKEPEDGAYKIVLTGPEGDHIFDADGAKKSGDTIDASGADAVLVAELKIRRSDLPGSIYVPKLYRGEPIMENLVCVSPALEL